MWRPSPDHACLDRPMRVSGRWAVGRAAVSENSASRMPDVNRAGPGPAANQELA